MENFLVSVIIPTYNRCDLLGRSIKSVLNQSYRNIEIIIVDDNSKDNTKSIVDSFLVKNLIYIKHNVNYGANKARNTGIVNSSGDVIAFLDSDDEWMPDKIQKQVDIFLKYSNVYFVYCGVVYKDNMSEKNVIPKTKGYIFYKQIFSDHVLSTSTWTVRKSCFYNVGLFDENLSARQDYDLSLRLSKRYCFDYVAEALAIIHSDGNERITDNIMKRIESSNIVLNKILKEIENKGFLFKKKVSASHYYQIARFAFERKERKIAKKYFMKCLFTYPFCLKYIVFYILSFFGNKAYYFPYKIKKRCVDFINPTGN